MSQCPCGLTQGQLDAKQWIDTDQCCTAKYKKLDGQIDVCGELYTSHPIATAGKVPPFVFLRFLMLTLLLFLL